MSLSDEIKDVLRARRAISEALQDKRRERDEVREQKARRKKRNPKDQQREAELEREIIKLAGEERQLTKRIRELERRDDKLQDKAEDLRNEKQDRKPDFDGCPENVSADVRFLVRKANELGATITATTNGTHAPGSYHYDGDALDTGGPYENYRAFQAWCAERPHLFRELFGPVNSEFVRYGQRYTSGEDALENAHDNHTHAAPYPGAFS